MLNAEKEGDPLQFFILGKLPFCLKIAFLHQNFFSFYQFSSSSFSIFSVLYRAGLLLFVVIILFSIISFIVAYHVHLLLILPIFSIKSNKLK